MQHSSKRILLYPSVGSGYGLGNLMRCSVLGNRLKQNGDVYMVLPENFKAPNPISFIGKFERTAINECPIESFQYVIFDCQGPINAEQLFSAWRSRSFGLKIVALDYFWLDSRCLDFVFNLSSYAVSFPKDESKLKYHHGLQYGILRPEFANADVNKVPESHPIRVLITFGGEDPKDRTMETILWLEKNVAATLEVVVLIGPANRKKDDVSNRVMKKCRHRYQIKQSVTDVRNYMQACHLGFCGGGTTLLEMACLGRPVIALPQNEMEAMFIDNFRKQGFIKGGLGNELIDGDHSLLRLFDDPELRQRLAKIGRRLVDGCGAERIAAEIMSQ